MLLTTLHQLITGLDIEEKHRKHWH